jgi:hypothetical protein
MVLESWVVGCGLSVGGWETLANTAGDRLTSVVIAGVKASDHLPSLNKQNLVVGPSGNPRLTSTSAHRNDISLAHIAGVST